MKYVLPILTEFLKLYFGFVYLLATEYACFFVVGCFLKFLGAPDQK